MIGHVISMWYEFMIYTHGLVVSFQPLNLEDLTYLSAMEMVKTNFDEVLIWVRLD